MDTKELGELLFQIDKLTREINAGKGDFDQLKILRKRAADHVMATAKDGKYLRLHPSLLGRLHKNDFPAGTVIRCRAYYIYPNKLKTYAETVRGKIVSESQMPQYLHRFVF